MSYAVITGASKGIGKEIALQLAAKKYNLLLVARSAEILKELAVQISEQYGVQCLYKAADLSDEIQVKELAEFIRTTIPDTSILVNNAGYGLWGSFETIESSKLMNMMDLNMRTPVLLTHKLVPVLQNQKQAYILNIASTAAYQAVPTLAIYAATKSFMVLFSRALHYELKNTNISVTCISPGATDTNFMDVAGMTTPEMQKRAEKFNMDPSTVAKFALDGMFKKKNEIIPGFINQFSVFMLRFVPKILTEKIAAGLYK
jgi:uncharacterized protein